MSLSSLIGQLNALWAQGEAFAAGSPWLAGVALAAALGVALALAVLLLGALWRIVSLARRAGMAARVRRTTDVGARILVIRGRAGRRGAVARFLKRTANEHLTDFMFGGPFRVIAFPGPVDSEEDANALLKRTEADAVLWSEHPRSAKGGLARIASRPASPFERQRPAQSLAMPQKKSQWTEALARATAYAAAKQYRPALGRPQDFRSERLQPVVENLLEVLTDKPNADPKLIAEMVDDAAAGALQLAFAGDEAWLDKSVEIARMTLDEVSRADAPDRWIAAKVTLGRALRLKAERQFDPVKLREAIDHLSDALEALRTEPRFKLAESAAQAIGDAQRLLGARRKFSISSGGI